MYRPGGRYPKKYVDCLRDEIEEIKKKLTDGKRSAFDSVDALFAKLEKECCLIR